MPDDPKVVQPAPPAPTPLETELKLTPQEVFAKYGIKDQPDEIIDVFDGDAEGKAIHDETVKHFGGPEGFADASRDLTEFASVIDPAGELPKAFESMTATEEAQAVREMVAEWRGVLGDPAKAKAVLNGLYGNPDNPAMKAYFAGNPAVADAFAKLFQAANGEAVVGRSKPQGDGLVY